MRQRVLGVLNTHTFRQSVITAFSTFTTAGLGAAFYLLLARFLGPNEYGLFSLSVTLLMLLVTVSDVGMAQGLVRFVGANKDTDKYLPFAAFALRTKLIMGAVCWFLLSFFPGMIAEIFFRQPELAKLLPITGLGIFSYLLISYSLSVSQAMQKFFLWGGIQIGSNALRLLLLFFLLLSGRTTPYMALLIFSAASLLGFLASWIWLDRNVFSAKITSKIANEFWKFNKWTAAFMFTSTIVSRLDVMLSARYLNLSSVGAYSLAVMMVSFLPQLSTAIGAVTSAKFAGFKRMAEAKAYLKKATAFSMGAGLAVALLMIPAALLVIWFAGNINYGQAFVPFLILLASLVIFMAGNPLRDYLLYFSHRPRIFFLTSIGQGMVFLIMGLALIPKYGITGTAVSVLAGQIFLALACLKYYLSPSRS